MSAVENGTWSYVSASSINSFDVDQDSGCPRRGYFKYALGFKEPFTKANKIGVTVHNEIEHYIKTGETTLGYLAMRAKHFIPRGPRMIAEHAIFDDDFRISGVKVKGYIDLLDPFDDNGVKLSTDSEGEIVEDPENTVEVHDWKTTKNLQYAKSGPQLLDTNQMIIYGAYAVRKYEARYVRLSHVYMQTKGEPDNLKSTILISREEVEKRFAKIESKVDTMKTLVREIDVNVIPCNTKACYAYNRQCPFFDKCKKSPEDLVKLIAKG